MTPLALTMVLLSAVAHATWNFLLKRSNDQDAFVLWLMASISVLLLPLALVLGWRYPIVYPGWWFILGTAILHALYFALLGRSYVHADLSLVYPLARGMGPALVPVLGATVLRESIAPTAIAGIIAVVIGVYTVYWWGRLAQIVRDPFKVFREPGTRYALLTGVVIAVYTVWDKVGVRYVDPFLYMYLMSLGSALLLAPLILKRRGMKVMRTEWRYGARDIVIAGLLTFLAYGLVLAALQFSRVSYISPAREIGIVISVGLGTLVLKEPFGRGRMVGSALVVSGVGLIAVAG